MTPEQRRAQLESWKRLYDWIRIDEGSPIFGQIRNKDRFGLAAAAERARSSSSRSTRRPAASVSAAKAAYERARA